MSTGGVWGVPKILEHFFWTFDHFRLFKSSGRKDSVQKPNTFSEANKMNFYAVLSHFSKCRDLRVNGGVQPIRAMPVFRPLFLKNGFPKSPTSCCPQVTLHFTWQGGRQCQEPHGTSGPAPHCHCMD